MHLVQGPVEALDVNPLSGGCKLLNVGGRVGPPPRDHRSSLVQIDPRLPSPGRSGGQWVDHRRVPNQIM
jgi:hypothetical protein